MKKLLSLFMIPSLALLADDGNAQTVRSPYVTKGVYKVENKGKFEFDPSGDEFESEFEFGYGLTDWLEIELEAVFKDEAGEDLDYSSTKVATKFQLTEKNQYFVDAGFYVGYKFPTDPNASEELQLELLLAKEYTKWRHRANFNMDQEVGKDRSKEAELELEWQTFYKATSDLKYGLEYYGDFKEWSETPTFQQQSHIIGPVAQYEFDNGLEMQLGYLFGITDAAADGTLKWKIEYKF